MGLEALFQDDLPSIEGDTLRLRALVAADAAAVFDLYCDKEANRFGYCPKMDDLDDAHRLIDEIACLARERTIFHWGLARRSDDLVVGHATLFKLDPRHRRAEIGYSIHRRCWRRGLGSEGVSLLIAFAFERLDLRRLEAEVEPRNVASLRLLEKLSFLREGYLRERWDIDGDIQDGMAFGLLRRDWIGSRSETRAT